MPAPIEVVTHIVDEQNRQKFDQKASLSAVDFSSSQTAAYTVDLPLASLQPGAYLLTMDITTAREKSRRNVRFTVR